MRISSSILVLAAVIGAAGCATRSDPTSGTTASAQAPASSQAEERKVRSRDGRFEGEMVGTPARGSKFSKLQIGMEMTEVLGLIGGPDNINTHETGKRWIPFYFGNDARRAHVYYKGEGCLTYTGGNAWGGGSNELIKITVSSRADCID